MNIFSILIVCFLVGELILNSYVNWLNIKYLSPFLPDEFKGSVDVEQYKKSQNYLKENTYLSLIELSTFTLLTLVMIFAGGFNFIDVLSRHFGFGEILSGLIFIATIVLLAQAVKLPFSLFHTFVIEEKYGFNKSTLKTFISDRIKTLILAAIFGGIALSLLIEFFSVYPIYGWLYVWMAFVALQLFMTYIAPTWIMPLFNKFTPLTEGDLKTGIESYAKSQNFTLNGIYVMDGSKRSSKSNAFFTGFGNNRRIVLFDTLIAKHSTDELIAVLAHEMGHFKKKHIIKLMLFSIIMSALTLYLFSWFINNRLLFDAFRMEHFSIYASLFFFLILYTPIEMLFGVLGNYFSRKYEFEADRFSANTYQKKDALINALKKLSIDNLSNLTPHPLKVICTYSHPPVVERIKSIKALQLP